MEASTDQKNFHDIMRIMAVNIGPNYFHNEYFRFAQILIMKIILTDIHGIFPHNCEFWLHDYSLNWKIIWSISPQELIKLKENNLDIDSDSD